ncbi:MAG: hypothetical protein MJZ74_01090 [Muribaculaceae bacterium]|nr:hypothetical protein [Muribaculaceae bacterium]
MDQASIDTFLFFIAKFPVQETWLAFLHEGNGRAIATASGGQVGAFLMFFVTTGFVRFNIFSEFCSIKLSG